jgi:hypothetical protein
MNIMSEIANMIDEYKGIVLSLILVIFIFIIALIIYKFSRKD